MQRVLRLAPDLSAWLDQVQPRGTPLLVVLALTVGLTGGVIATGFRAGIELASELFLTGGERLLAPLVGRWYVALLPVVGFLSVVWLLRILLRGEAGHGVAGIMERVALAGGRLPVLPTVARTLGAMITIGSGGSVGPEDPSVGIGATVGSVVGRWTRVSDDRVRTLVACGAAAGIASSFNAPLTGVFFALEVVLGELTAPAFAVVVLAAVASAAITHALTGTGRPAFAAPSYEFLGVWELVFYAALGIVAAGVAVAYVRAIFEFEDFFKRLRLPFWAKAVAGGLVVGLVGVFFPQILGVGYATIGEVLAGDFSRDLRLLSALVALKLLMTAVTLGAGGVGGLFAPSLFMGTMLGAAFAEVLGILLPGTAPNAPAYALVGMAAVLAGAVRAPITAMFLPFELTGDYRVILPLMAATVLSYVLSEYLFPESVYSLSLARRGIRLDRGRDIDVMQGLTVGEVMTTDPETVSEDLSLAGLAEAFGRTHRHGFPVLSRDGKLVGIVTIQDLERALAEKRPLELPVKTIATSRMLVAYPEEPVWAALKRLGTRDLGRLPVVDRDDPTRLLGVVRRRDIIRAYNTAIVRRQASQQREEHLRLGRLTGAEFLTIRVAEGSPLADAFVRDVAWPEESLLVAVRRNRHTLIPHGDTVLCPGDELTIYCTRKAASRIRQSTHHSGRSALEGFALHE